MREELETSLREAFPRLYGDRFSFQCPDHWFDIIYGMSAELDKLAAESEMQIRVVDVKEKHGMLSVLAHNTSNEMDAVIDTAERAVMCLEALMEYSAGRLSRHTAMQRLGLTWYGDLIDMVIGSGLSMPELPRELIEAQAKVVTELLKDKVK